jgi:hypothetical protein
MKKRVNIKEVEDGTSRYSGRSIWKRKSNAGAVFQCSYVDLVEEDTEYVDI